MLVQKTAQLLVTLQEILPGSVYKNSSKNRAKLSLVFGHFCSNAIMNDLSMTFTSRLKVDAKCVSAVKLDHGGELFWDTPS